MGRDERNEGRQGRRKKRQEPWVDAIRSSISMIWGRRRLQLPTWGPSLLRCRIADIDRFCAADVSRWRGVGTGRSAPSCCRGGAGLTWILWARGLQTSSMGGRRASVAALRSIRAGCLCRERQTCPLRSRDDPTFMPLEARDGAAKKIPLRSAQAFV